MKNNQNRKNDSKKNQLAQHLNWTDPYRARGCAARGGGCIWNPHTDQVGVKQFPTVKALAEETFCGRWVHGMQKPMKLRRELFPCWANLSQRMHGRGGRNGNFFLLFYCSFFWSGPLVNLAKNLMPCGSAYKYVYSKETKTNINRALLRTTVNPAEERES
jgi:hypothetical protein